MLIRLFRLLLAYTIIATFLLPLTAIPADSPVKAATPVTIDISSLTSFFSTLPPDEKDEQLRDWALYGLKGSLGLSSDEDIPIRNQALLDIQPCEVAPGRVFVLSTNEWGVLVPDDLLKNKPLIGGLVDKKYVTGNSLPERVVVFSYRSNASSSNINISFENSIKSKDLFTPEYGY